MKTDLKESLKRLRQLEKGLRAEMERDVLTQMEKINQLGMEGTEAEFVEESERQGYDPATAKQVFRIVQKAKATAPTIGFAKSNIAMGKARSLAVGISDEPASNLHEIAETYRPEIVSGEVEKLIQEKLLKAIADEDLPQKHYFAIGLVKARAAGRICAQSDQPQPGTPQPLAINGRLSTRELASTIGKPQDIPQHLGGTGSVDPWEQIVRQILGATYPTEIDAMPLPSGVGDRGELKTETDRMAKRNADRLELARSIGSATNLPDHLGGSLRKK